MILKINKIIVCLIILITESLNCYSQDFLSIDVENIKINGKVKEVKYRTYESDTISKVKREKSFIVLSFNENNRIKLYSYFKDSNLYWKSEYFYDLNNLLLKKIETSDKKIIEFFYTYNEKFQLLNIKKIQNGKSNYETEFTYDNKENSKFSVSYYNGYVSDIKKYFYDNLNRCEKMLFNSLNPKDKQDFTMQGNFQFNNIYKISERFKCLIPNCSVDWDKDFEYDNKGNVIKEINYFKNGNKEFINYSYEFDSLGNWTSRVIKSGKNIYYTMREFIFYE